jgi:hypothetical protein
MLLPESDSLLFQQGGLASGYDSADEDEEVDEDKDKGEDEDEEDAHSERSHSSELR